VLGSVAFCGGLRALCRGRRAPAPDTVTLPAPPPDTVVVVRQADPEVPAGTSATICLATGESVDVRVTPAGDTLVGPPWIPVRELPPGLVFEGIYAEGHEWFESGDPMRFDGGEYVRTGEPSPRNCSDIVRVGEHENVPLFANRGAEAPFTALNVPVRPGTWQAYQRR